MGDDDCCNCTCICLCCVRLPKKPKNRDKPPTPPNREEEPLILECITASQLSQKDCKSSSTTEKVRRAFGPGGPGIILVKGLCDEYHVERKKLLRVSRNFSRLPMEDKRMFELETVDYSTGWSCGKEKFRGKADHRKGSFYANPLIDDPSNGDEDFRTKYPHYMTPNVWPAESVVADFTSSFKYVGRYLSVLGNDLAWHCDKLVQAVVERDFGTGFNVKSIHTALLDSKAAKGRLLHYFSTAQILPEASASSGVKSGDPGSTNNPGFWCGIHNDHSCITGLCSASFVDEDTSKEVPAPKEAGLYVSIGGKMRKVNIPSDCVGFQIGETAQIITGGILQATPHAVKMSKEGNLSRSTFALFLQPDPRYVLKQPKFSTEMKDQDLVPPLSSRFSSKEECTFAEFARRTVQAYLT
eukprot:Plantae.Rhodophyta-Hildenbrandia_rubra.ctg17628.p1 GENE.Plantae.Rhodophyta-Hildenbrandia_rubra.ctg17628~~Plantae.Rhodophyta-Hildenbrandia_rubra.ctg17628.p1  ORF type:complete len:412 (-),score=68.54 Plantae.Rhodophyta-Hildenbrandia_rubra.ctg17628:1207-2442(-)